MLIEIILENGQESKLNDFENNIVKKGFEKISLSKDDIFIGPNKHEIRLVLKRNVAHRADEKIRIITDEPTLIKMISGSFDVFNIHVR